MMGHPAVFMLACLIIVIRGAMGPVLHYSDTWQLAINTSTTIVTFLMVFLIQNTQNRESEALHLKIDELLRALEAANTRLVDLEERGEGELEKLRQHYKALATGLPAAPASAARDSRAGWRAPEPIIAKRRSRPTNLKRSPRCSVPFCSFFSFCC